MNEQATDFDKCLLVAQQQRIATGFGYELVPLSKIESIRAGRGMRFGVPAEIAPQVYKALYLHHRGYAFFDDSGALLGVSDIGERWNPFDPDSSYTWRKVTV